MDQGSYSEQKRGKNVQGKRQYGCPCGKTYLSYPALFTHVKQKHNGKAPGKLTKPKKEKPRGRPKIHVDLADNDMSDVTFNLEEQIEKILENVQITYNQPFQPLQGVRTCQNMATSFLSELSEIDDGGKKVLNCFLNQLKNTVDQKNGQKYWKEEKPSQIIDLANAMCKSHQDNKRKFPLERDLLIELVFLLFRWMYKNRWTDHKLVKKKIDTE